MITCHTPPLQVPEAREEWLEVLGLLYQGREWPWPGEEQGCHVLSRLPSSTLLAWHDDTMLAMKLRGVAPALPH